jgi:hypothetical protein
MTDDATDDLSTPLGQTRQVTIDALCEHFANDAMGVEEFERRVDVAHQAVSVDQLRELLRDLPGGGLPVPVASAGTAERPAGGYSLVPADQVRESGYAIAILGGQRRAGHWVPARVNTTIAFCGGAELDFREAALGPGVTEVRVVAIWGGVEIIVPPGLNVESSGVGIMGGFDHAHDVPREVNPGAPTLRVSGIALMGGVEITVRHAGESARDARQRRRIERRERLRGRRRHLRGELSEVRDSARDLANDVKRQLRGPGSGPV